MLSYFIHLLRWFLHRCSCILEKVPRCYTIYWTTLFHEKKIVRCNGFKFVSHQLFPHHTHFMLMTFILFTQSDDQISTDQCVWSTWLDWSLLLHGCSSLFHSLGAQGTHPDVSIAFLSIKCCPCSTGGRVCVCVCRSLCLRSRAWQQCVCGVTSQHYQYNYYSTVVSHLVGSL